MPGIVGLTDLVERYFYSNQWLWIFIGSLVYLFFRMNTARKRAFLTAIAFFFLFVNSFVIEKFTALGENGTFYRHLWAIPSIVIVGIAIVDLIRIMPKWYLRIPVIAALIVGVWFVNNQEYIRCRSLKFSTDAKMVSEDMIELADGFEELRNETKKNKLFVVCGSQTTELSLYSGILNITGPELLNSTDHDGSMELMGGNPDIPHIMSVCCSNGMDYVVVDKNENTESAFREQGYEPVIQTNSFLVFQCSGYSGFFQDVNNFGRTSVRSYYDENGKPVLCSKGYCTVLYDYDYLGRKERELYYDENGDLCSIGHASVCYEYDLMGNCVKEIYYDRNGKEYDVAGLYASIEKTYTKKGNLETQRYLDANGEPVLANGCYLSEYEYDDKGNQICEKYYDASGNPMLSTNMQAFEKRVEYDENNNAIKEEFYDLDGSRIQSTLGYSICVREVDEERKIVSEEYYDETYQLLGRISRNEGNNNDEFFTFLHCSNGVSITSEGEICFKTIVPNNHFDGVWFQLYDAVSGRYIKNICIGRSEGAHQEIYTHEQPSGLYKIALRGNTILTDENIWCFEYIEEGKTIRFSYDLQELNGNRMQLSDVKVIVDK